MKTLFYTVAVLAVLASSAAAQGWQELNVDLNDLNWHSETEPSVAASWGGVSGVVATLRLHPVTQGKRAMSLDWLTLKTGQAASELDPLPLDAPYTVSPNDARHAIYHLNMAWPTPARVLQVRDDLEWSRPAATLVMQAGRQSASSAGAGWLILALSGVALAATAGLAGSGRATAALAGLSGLAALSVDL